MTHRHPTTGTCAACDATGLPYVKASELKPGMLIQTVFRPWLGQVYEVGEVATVQVEPLDVVLDGETVQAVTWTFAWYLNCRDGEVIAQFADGTNASYMIAGYSEYALFEPGEVQRPAGTGRYDNERPSAPVYPGPLRASA
ncbi:hypothetical protein ACFVV7_26650 [Streptomyces globisporus]|uniref:hypothetical protein n=1 Tax=Streptomyces globisporus TaxID=1908 RepID=UPI0036DA849E